MLVHKVYAGAKKILPERLAKFVRASATALLTPVYFSTRTGHFSSSIKTKAVDSTGKPLPWYTYPLINLLSAKNFSEKTVLEFGAGQSTRWWASKAKQILSFEGDKGWFESLKNDLPQNVELHHVADADPQISTIIGKRSFDVIIVDGLDRLHASKVALQHLKKHGIIILDNAEGYWGPEGTYPIMDLFREQNFSRVDFYGHAPGVILPHCSSVFFRDSCFIFEGTENPIRD
jgi:hypothetical protein